MKFRQTGNPVEHRGAVRVGAWDKAARRFRPADLQNPDPVDSPRRTGNGNPSVCRDLFGRACLGAGGCGFDPQAGPAALSQRGAQTGLSVLRQRSVVPAQAESSPLQGLLLEYGSRARRDALAEGMLREYAGCLIREKAVQTIRHFFGGALPD